MAGNQYLSNNAELISTAQQKSLNSDLS